MMLDAQAGAYLLRLEVENLRCFKTRQVLDLSDGEGGAARFTLILGENGTGKTTLLQAACAVVWYETVDVVDIIGRAHPHDPRPLGPAREVSGLWVRGNLSTGTWTEEASYRRRKGGPGSGFSGFLEHELRAPMIVAYGATRQVGAERTSSTPNLPSVASLFDDPPCLRDPEEWLLVSHYNALLDQRTGPAEERLERVRTTLIALLPDVRQIHLPDSAPTDASQRARVRFETDLGTVLLEDLSLGYRTVIAWVVDLAARMFERYPTLDNPLAGPAVVLVDEIDLHLHPRWQREILGFLARSFPSTQFIATAHSPLVVQAAEATNLVLLRRTSDTVVVENEPEQVHGWRVDQILTSELFGLETARPIAHERMLVERAELVQLPSRTRQQEARLAELDAELDAAPLGDTRADRAALDLLRDAADLIRRQTG